MGTKKKRYQITYSVIYALGVNQSLEDKPYLKGRYKHTASNCIIVKGKQTKNDIKEIMEGLGAEFEVVKVKA